MLPTKLSVHLKNSNRKRTTTYSLHHHSKAVYITIATQFTST